MRQEYDTEKASIIAMAINELNKKYDRKNKTVSFAQQYSLNKGLQKFGKRGEEAAFKEVKQLHQRECFIPKDVTTLTLQENKRAMKALMLLTEKRDKTIKGRSVYNEKPTRNWLSREDVTSPTSRIESIMTTAVIDAHEQRDIETIDIPNTFIQAERPYKQGDEMVMMKITGVLVDMLVNIAPQIYEQYVIIKNGEKKLYVQVIKAIYGTLDAAMLWYKKFKKDLEEEQGFIFNPYDPCMAN